MKKLLALLVLFSSFCSDVFSCGMYFYRKPINMSKPVDIVVQWNHDSQNPALDSTFPAMFDLFSEIGNMSSLYSVPKEIFKPENNELLLNINELRRESYSTVSRGVSIINENSKLVANLFNDECYDMVQPEMPNFVVDLNINITDYISNVRLNLADLQTKIEKVRSYGKNISAISKLGLRCDSLKRNYNGLERVLNATIENMNKVVILSDSFYSYLTVFYNRLPESGGMSRSSFYSCNPACLDLTEEDSDDSDDFDDDIAVVEDYGFLGISSNSFPPSSKTSAGANFPNFDNKLKTFPATRLSPGSFPPYTGGIF